MKKMRFLIFVLALFANFGMAQCEGTLSYTVSVPPGPNNTYPPGSVVELCVTMDGWNGNSQGSNWFEGFFFALGGGWQTVTPTLFPDDAEGDGSGIWIWATSTTSDNGATAGNGFYFEGPTGPVDGNGGNDWGDSCPSATCIWTACVELTANGPPGTDLHIGVIPYSDGTMGSWGTQMCNEVQTSFFDGSIGCFIPGCVNNTACNFNPNADCDDGSCIFPGCTDNTACNYDVNAGCDDGSCTFPGCIDVLACNYNQIAGCDDGSCSYFSMGSITPSFPSDTVCVGLEMSYSVAGNTNSIYEWNVIGGDIILPNSSNDCTVLWGTVPGTYTISVQEITDQGCIGSIETYDVVLEVPNINFNHPNRICLNQLTGLFATPINGNWVEDYVNGNSFIGYQSGIYNLTYEIDFFGCDYSEVSTIEVEALYDPPTIIYTKKNLDLCNDPNEQAYSVNDTSSVSFVWSIDNSVYTTESDFYIKWYDTTRTYLLSVYGINDRGCRSQSAEINIHTDACQSFYAPNTFTPNGDGINDIFIISGLSVYEPLLTIYNRAGAIVHQSSQLFWTGDGGNGYYSQNDVYNWTIEYRDRFGTNRKEKGSVTLVR
jgi:gliding motility-associated-like protein